MSKNHQLWSISQLSKEFRHGIPFIKNALKKVDPAGTVNKVPGYYLIDVVPYLVDPAPVSADDIDPDTLTPRDRDAWFSSENRRLAMEESKRDLWRTGEVVRALSLVVKRLVQGLGPLVDEIEAEFNLDPKALELLNKKVEQTRADMYAALHDEVGDQIDNL